MYAPSAAIHCTSMSHGGSHSAGLSLRATAMRAVATGQTGAAVAPGGEGTPPLSRHWREGDFTYGRSTLGFISILLAPTIHVEMKHLAIR